MSKFKINDTVYITDNSSKGYGAVYFDINEKGVITDTLPNGRDFIVTSTSGREQVVHESQMRLPYEVDAGQADLLHNFSYRNDAGQMVRIKRTPCRHYVAKVGSGNYQRVGKATALMMAAAAI